MDSRETQATIPDPTLPEPRVRSGEGQSGGAAAVPAPERSGGERWDREKSAREPRGTRSHCGPDRDGALLGNGEPAA